MTDNELIAEFMDQEAWASISHNRPIFPDYDKSWNDLMLVVEKIQQLGFYPHSGYLRSEKANRNFFSITTSNHSLISDAVEPTMIMAHYKAVVNFIKWYQKMETNKTREEGTYRVKFADEWIEADWFANGWALLIDDGPKARRVKDSDLQAIDETPITRNEHGQES